ncbi:nucleolar protein dao-5-like [Anneissia japonica]|uniref:nucleolar protein dao-5-like n=1 Tax=Anneissia japonica TaxID=1529436 RepID=UPI0014259DCF|nr:nucleolar protein dao-5-like [Anneissia japonica]
MYVGACVHVLREGKFLPATIRQMSDNPDELLSLQREFIQDKRERVDTSSSDSSDSDDDDVVATTSIKKTNPKTSTSKTSQRVKDKEYTNNVFHRNSMSVRQQRACIPREALVYFPDVKSFSIVKTSLISGDMYFGADVNVLWKGKLVPAIIRQMSDNPHKLLSLQRESLRNDKRKRVETSSSDSSDSDDNVDVATTSIKKTNPKTSNSKTSKQVKGKEYTNKVINRNSVSVYQQRTYIPREAPVAATSIKKTNPKTSSKWKIDVEETSDSSDSSSDDVVTTTSIKKTNPKTSTSKWKTDVEVTSDSSDSSDDDVVTTTSIKKTNTKTSTSKTSKTVKDKERTNKVMSIYQQRTYIPREELVAATAIKKTNPKTSTSKWKIDVEETSDSSDSSSDDVVATTSIKKTNPKTSTSKTSKNVTGKEIPSVSLRSEPSGNSSAAIQQGNRCHEEPITDREGDFAAMEATLQNIREKLIDAPEWLQKFAYKSTSLLSELINQVSELQDQHLHSQAGTVPKPLIHSSR